MQQLRVEREAVGGSQYRDDQFPRKTGEIASFEVPHECESLADLPFTRCIIRRIGPIPGHGVPSSVLSPRRGAPITRCIGPQSARDTPRGSFVSPMSMTLPAGVNVSTPRKMDAAPLLFPWRDCVNTRRGRSAEQLPSPFAAAIRAAEPRAPTRTPRNLCSHWLRFRWRRQKSRIWWAEFSRAGINVDALVSRGSPLDLAAECTVNRKRGQDRFVYEGDRLGAL